MLDQLKAWAKAGIDAAPYLTLALALASQGRPLTEAEEAWLEAGEAVMDERLANAQPAAQ